MRDRTGQDSVAVGCALLDERVKVCLHERAYGKRRGGLLEGAHWFVFWLVLFLNDTMLRPW